MVKARGGRNKRIKQHRQGPAQVRMAAGLLVVRSGCEQAPWLGSRSARVSGKARPPTRRVALYIAAERPLD
jgi:hypothetical protein